MKGIIFPVKDIGYLSIPKTACTAIKRELYRLEKGEEFSREKVGTHIHNFLGKKMTGGLSNSSFNFIVIRDPVKRFLSAYANRVVHHKELSKKYIEKNHPELIDHIEIYNPSLSFFINNLDLYFKVDTIRHHFKPLADFLSGESLSFFSCVYKLEQVDKLESDLSKYTGQDVKFGREQTGGPKLKVIDLSRNQLATLLEFYSQDYEILRGLYSKQEILDIYEEEKKALVIRKEK